MVFRRIYLGAVTIQSYTFKKKINWSSSSFLSVTYPPIPLPLTTANRTL